MNHDINQIISQLKIDTHYSGDITYRVKKVCKKNVWIIYNEPLTSSDKISDFIIRSLDKINRRYSTCSHLDYIIANEIDNFKIKKISTYKDICYYLHNGFTILLLEDISFFFVLETRRSLSRSVSEVNTENTLRGAMDGFVEDMQTNIGLIRRRIKDNKLWSKSVEIGRYTKTVIQVFYIKDIVKIDLVNYIYDIICRIDIDGVIQSGTIKNLIEKENKSVFPTVISTERPDRVCQALLNGKIVILVDCSPFALILPIVMNDMFLSIDDDFSKSINVSMTRFIRYISFFISLLTPGIYLALTTYHQVMLPTSLLVGFASQRAMVPFPAIVEVIVMLFSFEILRECDLRSPSFTTSALSTVGALILGEAAVNAGIVSPIMIIVTAITSLAALIFTEPEMTNGLRWYRILFMFMGIFMGIVGILLGFIFLIIQLCSLNSFGVPYFSPFSPVSSIGLRDSIVRFPIKDLNKRERFFSNNRVKYRDLDRRL